MHFIFNLNEFKELSMFGIKFLLKGHETILKNLFLHKLPSHRIGKHPIKISEEFQKYHSSFTLIAIRLPFLDLRFPRKDC